MALPMQLQSNQGLAPNQILGGNQRTGGWIDGIRDFFLGQPSRIEQFTNYTPQQQQNFNSAASSGLQSIMNPYAGFEPIKNQYETEFEQKGLPGLAERFSSLGNNQIATSPSFASQTTGAKANLSQGLAALQAQYGLQNRQQGLSELSLGQTPQYQSVNAPGSAGLLGGLLGNSGQGGGLELLIKLLPLLMA
jgi:hypothetical protein